MSFTDCNTTQRMGFVQDEWGDFATLRFKRKFRWKFIIPDISASGVNSLPPTRSARPSLSFSEIRAEHLNETIYYPGKPDWRTLNLVLYDIVKPNENPIFSWIKRVYHVPGCVTLLDCQDSEQFPKCSEWFPSCDEPSLKAVADLELYDGCGCVIESWRFEHVWPQAVEFGDLEMNNSEFITADVTLRYDRAYITNPGTVTPISFTSLIDTCVNPEAPCATETDVCKIVENGGGGGDGDEDGDGGGNSPGPQLFAPVSPGFKMLW